MPSREHEALCLLFERRPELAPELLRRIRGVKLPAYRKVKTESADFTKLMPASFHADRVVLLVARKPVLAIIVEVQISRDERKLFTWPVYVTSARARFQCPAVVLVVTTSAVIARWAARPIVLGPGASLAPLVVGPDGVPLVTQPRAARRDPELAILSVMAHGRGKPDVAARIALAAAKAASGLDEEHFLLYLSLIRSALSEAAKKAFQMLPEGQQFFDQSMQKSFEKGIEKGIEKGMVASKAADIIEVLEARGIAVSDTERERILACTHLDTLRRWHRTAVTVASADALLRS